jgi:serine protease AprX
MSPRVTEGWRGSPSARRRTGRRAAAAAVASSALAAVVLNAGPAGAAVTPALGYDPVAAKGSLYNVASAVGALDSYRAGYTGKGIGVALIDTGVSPVKGLTSGNVVNGPDLSFDSQDPSLAYLDEFGHGTHLGSIIAGRDAAGSPSSYTDPSRFTGIAPDSTLVNVKVGARDGAVDVTQVIAAIDWVVEHKDDNGMNIRVINLSYGTDSTQDTTVDPLAFAAENAWKHGIVVVVAGGNDGSDNYNLANPARDPYVLAVGAADTAGTPTDVSDDTVPAWGTRGTNQRHVDVVAPGVSVIGARVPGGYEDERNPQARVGDRFAKASGTSQATAVVSGEVALLLQRYPDLTPDQVKKMLMTTARPMPGTSVQYRGNGLTDVRAAQLKSPVGYSQPQSFLSDGSGSIDAARGSSHVNRGGVALTGEVDIFGRPWDAKTWATASANGTAWDGGTWRGERMTGNGWVSSTWGSATWGAATWGAATWGAATWGAATWGAATWSDVAWDAKTWRSDDWSAKTWRDGSWTAATWSSATWSSATWSSATWSAKTWRAADLASVTWG